MQNVIFLSFSLISACVIFEIECKIYRTITNEINFSVLEKSIYCSTIKITIIVNSFIYKKICFILNFLNRTVFIVND